MRSRTPSLDFAQSLPLWARNRAFCHRLNAASVVAVRLEPYLNKVMRRARDLLPADDPLRGDIDIFIRQEATHYQIHRRYNQALYDAGYDAVPGIERELEADYERFLNERSLKAQLGYCEGFECLGPLLAEFLYEQADDLLAGGDPAVIELWRWHLAEEYEHRMVAYRVYHRFGGNWLHRLYTTYTTLRHLNHYNAQVERHLHAVDRSTMTPEQIEQSRQESREFRRRLSRFLWPRILRLLSPFYSPAGYKPPRGLERYLLE